MAKKATSVVLTFESPASDLDARRFNLLYSGFVAGGNLSQESGIEVLTSRVEIMKALKGISVEGEAGMPRQLRQTDVGGFSFALESDEFAMLRRYVLLAPYRIELSEDVAALVEWLDTSAKPAQP